METTYEFSYYNTESIYGYGTALEAEIYLNYLNRDLTCDLYEMSVSDLPGDQAEIVASNLRDDLAYLDSVEAQEN